mgnify:CR=1 FL=1
MLSVGTQLLFKFLLKRVLVSRHGLAPMVNINNLHQHVSVLLVFGIYPSVESIDFRSHLGNLALGDGLLSAQLYHQLLALGQAVLVPLLVFLEEFFLLLHAFATVLVFLVNFLHLFHEVAEQPIVLAGNFVDVLLQLVQILIESTLNLVGLVLEGLRPSRCELHLDC